MLQASGNESVKVELILENNFWNELRELVIDECDSLAHLGHWVIDHVNDITECNTDDVHNVLGVRPVND